jgi:hypothetical protein
MTERSRSLKGCYFAEIGNTTSPPASASTMGSIAEIGMTTTFPYLEVARVHGVHYADVLCYADTLDRSIRAWSPDWPRAAPAWIKDTEAAWCRERARRDLTARALAHCYRYADR